MTWLVLGLHVVPSDDYRPHDLDCGCWCKPTEDDQFADIFIHHAMDGREGFESGERLPS